MGVFLPTVELTCDVQSGLRGGWLTLSRGQWVSLNGGKGRFVSASENGLVICWRFSGEAFQSFNLRFKSAGQKRVRCAPPKSRVVEQLEIPDFSREIGRFDSLDVLMVRKADGVVLCRNRRTRRLVLGPISRLQERGYVWRQNPFTRSPWPSFKHYPHGWVQ